MAKSDDFIKYLTEGLDEEQARSVRDSLKEVLKNEKVLSRAQELKQKSEYDAIQTKSNELQSALDGADGKPGAKAYEQWYRDNFKAIEALQTKTAAYEAKYGSIDNPNPNPAGGTNPNPNPNPAPAGKSYSDEDIQRIVDARFQSQFAPNVTGIVKKLTTTVNRHILAGRKTEIDLDAIESIMAKKGLPIEQAYEEWDKPERDKEVSAKQEAEITRRVNEEIQKRGASQYFPAGADSTPGALSRRPEEKFDKAAMERDLVNTYIKGSDDGKLTGFGVN